MTTSEIKKALRRNKRLGRRPWSLYQIAQMRGCSRSLVTDLLKGHKRSEPLLRWIISVLKTEDAA